MVSIDVILVVLTHALSMLRRLLKVAILNVPTCVHLPFKRLSSMPILEHAIFNFIFSCFLLSKRFCNVTVPRDAVTSAAVGFGVFSSLIVGVILLIVTTDIINI